MVRLKKGAAIRQSDYLARWYVLEVEGRYATVEDVDEAGSSDSTKREFLLSDLERVAGGVDVVVGYEYVKELTFGQDAEDEDDADGDDPFDDGEVETPEGGDSLFDDPIALQMAEDEEDEDYDAA